MPIHIECQDCHETFDAPDEYAGRESVCPACRSSVVIPVKAKASHRNAGWLIPVAILAVGICVGAFGNWLATSERIRTLEAKIVSLKNEAVKGGPVLPASKQKIIDAIQQTYTTKKTQSYTHNQTGEPCEVFQIPAVGVNITFTGSDDALREVSILSRDTPESAAHAEIVYRATAKALGMNIAEFDSYIRKMVEQSQRENVDTVVVRLGDIDVTVGWYPLTDVTVVRATFAAQSPKIKRAG